MTLVQWMVDRWRGNERMEELAEQIAARCAPNVHRALSDQVFRMSFHESRGYVRTYASAVVQRATKDAGARFGIAEGALPELYALVLETTIRTVHHQLSSPVRLRIRKAA
jgi:hypothetical protein